MQSRHEVIMTKYSPLDDAPVRHWIGQFSQPAQAELCVRYALVFNTLNVNWLAKMFSPQVTYGSQSVFETLNGYKAVWEYLSGKIETLGVKPAVRPRAELASDLDGAPCTLMFQPKGKFDCNWLELPLAYVTFKTDARGLASSIFMVTGVPSPASARRSGIFPGVRDAVHERARQFIRPRDNYQGLRFSYFLLDGKMRLDLEMMEVAAKVQEAFPGATSSTLVTTGRTSAADELDEIGFIGFPAVAVYWQGEILFRHEGLVSADFLIEKIKGMTAMHVVTNHSSRAE